ncbi:hypothetical protein H2248_005043 [Termitomyces sp. 'cryptogamus']|nr:hypothetical protein H2248_005043 [Termitomyces sp. 'cryptogamus']
MHRVLILQRVILSSILESRLCTRAEACQKLVNDTVDGKDYGLNAAEAHDHVEEVQQRINIRNAKSKQPDPLSCESSPPSQVQAAEEAAWEALQARCEQVDIPTSSPSSITIQQLAELLSEPKRSIGSALIPQSLLSAVLHSAVLHLAQ